MDVFGSKSSQPGRKAVSLFGFGVQLFCLTLISAVFLIPVRAEVVPTPTGNAQDLRGATGSFSPLAVAPLVAQVPAARQEDPLDLLGEFNVTAQRRRTTERENTQTTYVVSKEDIKALGARTVTDALKLVPGFNFADTLGGVVSDTSNYLRGLNSQRFVFLIDGAPQSRASNGRADTIGTLPVINIERIEVSLGGSTLRYGADAVAGVINVITSIPAGPPKLFTSVQFGSYGSSQYIADYSGSNGVDPKQAGYFAYQVGYQRSSAINDYVYTYTAGPINELGYCDTDLPGACFPSVDDAGNVDPGNFRKGDFTANRKLIGGYVFSDFYYAKFMFKPGDDHTITAFFNQENRRTGSASNRLGCVYYAENYQSYQGYGTKNPAHLKCYGTDQSRDYGTSSATGLDDTNDSTRVNLVWEWNLSELNTLTTQFSYNSTFLAFANPGSPRFINDRVIDTSIRYTAELYPGNTLNLGAELRDIRSRQAAAIGLTPFQDPNVDFAEDGTPKQASLDKTISSWAIYITEDLRFFDGALIVNFGSRLTNNVFYGTFTTSGAGLRYNFGGEKGQEIFGLKFNWQQSFKAPSVSDLFNGGPINPPFDPTSTATSGQDNFQFKANPELQPEVGVGYDLGLDIALSPSALLRVTYYRTDLSNAISDGSPFVGIQDIGFGYAFTYQTINAQAFLSTGWEFTFAWEIDDHWSLNLSHSIVDSRPLGSADADLAISPFPVQAGFYYEYQTIDVPWNTTGINVTYDSPLFSASLTGQIVGPRLVLFGNFWNEGFSRWDITTRIPLGSVFTLTGGMFNIFGETNVLANNARLSTNGGVESPGVTFRVGLEATF